jgi:hypothetical protein
MTATVTRRIFAIVSAVVVLAGCSRSVSGIAVKEGAPAAPAANSAGQYPNVLKECDVLSKEDIANVVGADRRDIQATFYGAVCRWEAANPAGLVDVTRFWFEKGSLDNERKVAEGLSYRVENHSIAGVTSIVMRPNDPNGACGVASNAGGVIGWWVNPQVPGLDACGQAIKLMAMTLNTNA